MKNNISDTRGSFIKSMAAMTVLFSISPFKVLANISKSHNNMKKKKETLLLGMVVFDGFQLLDTFGPLEMFGSLKGKVEIVLIGENSGKMKSSAGPVVMIDHTFNEVDKT